MENNRRRMIAGARGFVVLIVVMFSSVYIARESVHDCHGEACPICVCLKQCEDMLLKRCDRLPGLILISISLAVFMVSENLPISCLKYETPVSRKVRLNN